MHVVRPPVAPDSEQFQGADHEKLQTLDAEDRYVGETDGRELFRRLASEVTVFPTPVSRYSPSFSSQNAIAMPPWPARPVLPER